MRNKFFRLTALFVMMVLLAGCGGDKVEQTVDRRVSETADTTLSRALAHVIFITVDESYPVEQTTVYMHKAEDRKREYGKLLTYDEALGGYITPMTVGEYEIRVVCDAPNVTYDQSRFIRVDDTHHYYYVRFTPTAYVDA